MLDFETYRKTCDDLTEQIRKANYKIVYREIEIIGHKRGVPFPLHSILNACNTSLNACNTSTSSNTTTTDEETALKNDLEYQRLVYARDDLQAEYNFIWEHAEYPHKDAEAHG